MTGQDSHGTRHIGDQAGVDSVDPWTIVHRALNKMAEASSARVVLTVLVHVSLRLTDADLAQVDFYTPTSKRFVSGGLAGKSANPSPLCPTPHQNALAQTALEQGRPLYRDLDASCDGFAEHIRHILVYPMLGSSLRGVVLVGYRWVPSRPIPDITRMLGVLVSQTSMILHQLGQRREEARRAADLALIDEIGRLVVESSAPAPALDKILDIFARNFDLCGILLYVGDPLSLYAAQSETGAPKDSHLTGGLAQQAHRTGRSLISNRVGQDERCEVPPWLGDDIRSEAAVPLTYQGEKVGVVDCFGMRNRTFAADDLRTLRTLGRLIVLLAREALWEDSRDVPVKGKDESPQLYQGPTSSRRQLKAAYQKLQEFAELKDQILQNISHELRTPLTLIKGHIELVLEDTSGRLTPAQRRGLEVAVLKSDEAVNIVEKIVSLSPLSSFALRYTAIPVGPLLESMADIVSRRVRDRPIRITVEPVEPDLSIHGDFDKIKQVCYNILDNSIKFSPRGGDILISASRDGGYVHLQFRDHGVGIPEKRISRIFDTFYQVDGSSTRRFGGLGLGLTVVHRVVEAHHGKVWAESEVDRGSVFHVLLPRYRQTSRTEGDLDRG